MRVRFCVKRRKIVYGEKRLFVWIYVGLWNKAFGIQYSKNKTISSRLWTGRVYPFTMPAECTCRVYPLPRQQYGRTAQGVSLSTTSNMDVQGVSLSTASSMNVQGVSLSTSAVWTYRVYSRSLAVWTCRGVHVSLFTVVKCILNAGLPDFPASCQSGTGITKRDASNSSVPECSGTGLRYRMPECRCPALPLPLWQDKIF